jgi:hypothetical protein
MRPTNVNRSEAVMMSDKAHFITKESITEKDLPNDKTIKLPGRRKS